MDLGFEVVDLPETDHPEEGDRVPDFERPLVNEEYWEDVSLSELTDEGPVVLVFHPMEDRKSTRLNSSHITRSRMPSSA